MAINKKALLESALFLSQEPLPLDRLSTIINEPGQKVKELLEEMKKDMENESRGIKIIESSNGYEFRVKSQYLPKVSHLTPYADLSRGLLKVLAIVAFKEPVTQSDIVKTIGNRTYDYVKELEGKNLIKSEKSGRTKLLKTTGEFMNYFGIEGKDELKRKFKEVSGR